MAANKKNNKTGSKVRKVKGNTKVIQGGGVSKARIAKSGKESKVKIAMKTIVTKVDSIRAPKRATKTSSRVTVKRSSSPNRFVKKTTSAVKRGSSKKPNTAVKSTSTKKSSAVKRTPTKMTRSAAKKTQIKKTTTKKAVKKSDSQKKSKGDWRYTGKKTITKDKKEPKVAVATTSRREGQKFNDHLLTREQISAMSRSEVAQNLIAGNISFRKLGDKTYPMPVRDLSGPPHQAITSFTYFVAYCRDMARLGCGRGVQQTIVERAHELAEAWCVTTGEDRKPFEDMERTDAVRYQLEMNVYNTALKEHKA